MKITLQSLHFNANDKLKAFAEEKVNKLSRYDASIISAEITLTEDGNKFDNKSCDIRLVVPGNDHLVKKSAPSFEEAIADSVDTLQVILTAKKEKFETR